MTEQTNNSAQRSRIIPPLSRDNTLTNEEPTITNKKSTSSNEQFIKKSNEQLNFINLKFTSFELEDGFLDWYNMKMIQKTLSTGILWCLIIIGVFIALFINWYEFHITSSGIMCGVGGIALILSLLFSLIKSEKVSFLTDFQYQTMIMTIILVLSILVLISMHYGDNGSDLGDVSLFYVIFVLSGLNLGQRFIYQLITTIIQVGGYLALAWIDEEGEGTYCAIGMIGIGVLVIKMSRDLELHVREEYQQGTDMQAVTRASIFSIGLDEGQSVSSFMTPLESAVMSLKRLHDAPGMANANRDTIKNVMGILYHLYDLDESPVPLSSVPIDQTTEAWLKKEMMLTGYTSIKKHHHRPSKSKQSQQIKQSIVTVEKPALKRGSSDTTGRIAGPSMPVLNHSDDENDKEKPLSKSRSRMLLNNESDVSQKTWEMMKTGQKLLHIGDAVYPEQSLPKDVMNRVENLLQKVDGWNFPVIELDEITKGNSLYFVALAIFQRRGFIEKFQLSPRRLRNFLLVVQSNYRPNPYHNSTHAADVTQTNHALLYEALDSEDYSFVIFCSVFACIIHDYEHTGVNNDFLVRSRDPRALVFNDRSCQENHHLAAAFACLSEDENNFVHAMSPERKKDMRKIVIDLVLATDMSQHNAILSSFRLKLSSGALKLEDEDSLLMILKMGIKCADISHTSKEDFLHAPWTERITNEFLNQGDLERELGLTVSPFMDRRNLLLAKSQLGFFQFIVEPLFEAWAKYLEVEEAPFLFHIKQNKEKYKAMRIIEEQKVAEATSAGQTDKK
eukprot:c21934_g2_i2.p1 GENE.c21934_g2_i2~~c21934_g2_i2.p1  ORF type:complete len:787 (+),score=321.97 c21934_g2_i2:97-2457(+)